MTVLVVLSIGLVTGVGVDARTWALAVPAVEVVEVLCKSGSVISAFA